MKNTMTNKRTNKKAARRKNQQVLAAVAGVAAAAVSAVEKSAAPAVQQQAAPAAEQKTETAAKQEKILTVPEGEINDWKTHEAKDGFPVGTFFEKVNNNSRLNVAMVNSYTYKITVTIVTGADTANVYDLTAIANGSKMYYKDGTKTEVVYNADGSVAESKLVDSTHNGTFDASDAGYTWVDTEGTKVFIPWIGYR